jgi:hypothetical protein
MKKDGRRMAKNKGRAALGARRHGFHPMVARAMRKVMKEMAECGFTG